VVGRRVTALLPVRGLDCGLGAGLAAPPALAGDRLVWTDLDVGNRSYYHTRTNRAGRPAAEARELQEVDGDHDFGPFATPPLASGSTVLFGRLEYRAVVAPPGCDPELEECAERPVYASTTIFRRGRERPVLDAQPFGRPVDLHRRRLLLLTTTNATVVDVATGAVDSTVTEGCPCRRGFVDDTYTVLRAGGSIRVYDSAGVLVRARRLRGSPLALDGGRLLWVTPDRRVMHVLTLSTGADRAVARLPRGDVLAGADIGPPGVVYAVNRHGSSHLVVVPVTDGERGVDAPGRPRHLPRRGAPERTA
jgi:hypothetical protein